MASEAEVLSLLIGEIYDAALDPPRWVDTLDKIRAFVVGCAASLYSKDAAGKHGAVLAPSGKGYCRSQRSVPTCLPPA